MPTRLPDLTGTFEVIFLLTSEILFFKLFRLFSISLRLGLLESRFRATEGYSDSNLWPWFGSES